MSLNLMQWYSSKAVIRKLDSLVNEFPEVYKCIGEIDIDIDKTYSVPKQYVCYHKLRMISEDVKKRRKELMKKINKKNK